MNKISYDKDIFAENLLRLMKEKHCKQIDIARLLDVSKATALGWTYSTELPDGIRLAYDDFLHNPMRAER